MKPMNEICHACVGHASRCRACASALLLDMIESIRMGARLSGLSVDAYLVTQEITLREEKGLGHDA